MSHHILSWTWAHRWLAAAVMAAVGAMALSLPLLADESEAQTARPAYAVILVDGSAIPAKSKPLSAFGSFRFVDTTGRTRVMPVAKVDLEATRAANAEVPDDPSRGTLSIASGVVFEPLTIIENEEEEQASKPPPKSITVYSATWCGYCKDLKRYLAVRKIPATVIEVDRLPQGEQAAAKATMQRLTGRVAFPTVVIGGEAQAGFSRSWIESKIKG